MSMQKNKTRYMSIILCWHGTRFFLNCQIGFYNLFDLYWLVCLSGQTWFIKLEKKRRKILRGYSNSQVKSYLTTPLLKPKRSNDIQLTHHNIKT